MERGESSMITKRKHIPTWLFKLGGRLDKQHDEIVKALSDINAFNAGKKRDIVDEETAWIVKRIFEYANAGMGPHKIVAQFREEQVPCPSWWLHQRGEKRYAERFENPENKYEWQTE